MATPFRLKRSAIEGKRPAQADLQLGELALNTYDGYLYTEREGVGLATVTNLTPWYENYGGGSIYYSNSVGIGTTVPQYKLDVRKGSIGGYDALRAPHSDVIVEIEVKVITKTEDHRYKGTGSNLGYTLDGVESPFLTLVPGRTYRFKQDDNSNSGHPIAFYLTANKATQYTGGVTTNGSAGSSGAYTQIVVGDETPTVLHYQCTAHGYMGNAVEVNSNVVNSNYAAILRGGLDVTSGNVDITQNLNVTGNLDVDGATTLDGTTIDGLLDINAGGQANTFKVEDLTSGRVVIVGTGGELEDSGNLLFNGTDLSAASLIVSDLTDNRVLIAGSSGAVEDSANLTFNGSLLSVTGGAAVDNVQIGVTGDNEIDTSSGDLTIDSAGGTTTIDDILSVSGNATFNSDLSVTNNVSIGGTLTVTGDVGIAGTLTYEDVARVDAVGLSTFREGLIIPDNQKASFGTDDDGSIKHTGTNLQIFETTGNIQITNYANDKDVVISSDDGSGGTTSYFTADGSTGKASLHYYGASKLETNVTGVRFSGHSQPSVNNAYDLGSPSLNWRTVYAKTGDFSGDLDVDGHTNLDNISVAGVSTFTGDATFSGSVSIGGTLTYEDVTNVDSVGLLTARSGIRVTGGVIEALAGENKIPSLYANMAALPAAGSYHGMFAHVHSTGRGYFAHAGNWLELVNADTTGRVGTGTESYFIDRLVSTSTTATSLNTVSYTHLTLPTNREV